VEYLDVFQEAYAAIMQYARSSDGLWVRVMYMISIPCKATVQFHSVSMSTGELAFSTVDSLSSFWPGLQVGNIHFPRDSPSCGIRY
jgi:ER degradation enhancer, mannosidase alpha-like 1